MTEPKNEHDFLGRIESETQDELHPFLKSILDNIKLIGIAFGIFLLGVAGYSGFSIYQQKQMEEARKELGSILAETTGDQKIQSLETFLDERSRLQTEALLELARAQMSLDLYKEAASTWDRLAGEADGQLLILSRLGQANALSLGGNPSEAVAVLKPLFTEMDGPYSDNIATQLAESAEQAGERETAIAAYERLLAESTSQGSSEYIEYKIERLKEKTS